MNTLRTTTRAAARLVAVVAAVSISFGATAPVQAAQAGNDGGHTVGSEWEW